MERLSTVDSVFLDIEREGGPALAVGGAFEFAGQPPTLAELRAFVASRLPEMARFKQRVVPSRSQLLSAKWVEVEPDLNHHVTLRKIGLGDTIEATVSKILAVPFDRTRPLWDCTLICGYATDQWTCVWRLHLSIAEGHGALTLLGRLIDVSSDGNTTLADSLAANSSTEESAEALIGRNRIEGLASGAVRTIEQGLDSLGQLIATSPDTIRTVLDMMPKRGTDLTGPVSDERKWVGAHYPLSHIKIASKAFSGVTINDMVLASVAVGFRRLLESRGDDPTGRTVRAVVPASARRGVLADKHMSVLPAPLPVGELNAIKRMKIIRGSTRQSSRSMAPQISDQLRRATERVTPRPMLYFMSLGGANAQYFGETLVTNVPGPAIPLYFMGREVTGSLPIIPIEGSMRIIIGVTSYRNALNIGMTGDGFHAADVDVLLAGTIEGLDELVELAAAVRTRT